MMEIEKKLVLQDLPEGVHSGRQIIQGYLWFDPEVRLRKIGGEHKLTIKSQGALTRDETELSVPGFLFDLLWPLTGSNVVRKTRYPLDYNDLVLEIDVYSGKHARVMYSLFMSVPNMVGSSLLTLMLTPWS